MRRTLLLIVALALCQGGCKRATLDVPGDPNTNQSGISGQTSLAGGWTGQFTITHADGITLPPNLQLSIPASIDITPAGAVTIDLGGGKKAAYERAGQLLIGNPFSADHVSVEVEKLEVSASRIHLKTRSRTATVSPDHRDPLLNDTSKRDEMTFSLDGDSLVVSASGVAVTKSKRSTTAMSGKFTRSGRSANQTGDSSKGGKSQVDPNDYYPLQVGHVWRLKSSEGSMVLTAAAEETVGSEKCIRLEASRNGQLLSTEHLVRRADGIYRAAYNGARLDPLVLILRLPPKSGDKWKVDIKVGGESATGEVVVSEEAVTVPAGKFDGVKVRSQIDSDGTQITSEHWYAKGVGIVKQRAQASGRDLTFELEKFEPAR